MLPSSITIHNLHSRDSKANHRACNKAVVSFLKADTSNRAYRENHTPIRERPLRKATPALISVHEANVKKQQDRLKILRDHDGHGSTNETPPQLPHQEPVDKHIERRGNH